MKILKVSLFILIATALFTSCQKEYSVEGNNLQVPSGSWQFADSLNQYVGNIDSAFIDSNANTKTLHINGKSIIGDENFSIQLFSTDSFPVGTYRATFAQVEFDYFNSTKTVYQASQLTGEFIVNITSIGNNSISGTFSGSALDSAGNIRKITLGKFTSTLNTGSGAASGTLGSLTGNCVPITLAGTYTKGVALTASNTAEVQVNVTAVGAYTISTNKVNGVTFSSSGTFTNTGMQNVFLIGSGTPIDSASQNYTVTFGNSLCNFSINYLGKAPITGTLGGAPGNCTPATAAGTFTQGVPLDASNTITVQVNVTALGAYTISTNTVDGISFSKSGSFTTTGMQNVILAGTGTPTTSGTQDFAILFGNSSCNFSLVIDAQSTMQDAVFTLSGAPDACTAAIVNGNYNTSVDLDPTVKTVDLQVNVTSIGHYMLSTNTVNGITFLGMGTFITTGMQTVTLKGTGTPLAPGTYKFTPQARSSSCTFDVTVTDIVPGFLTCKIDGVFTTFNTDASATFSSQSGTNTLSMSGSGMNNISYDLEIAGAITITNGTYDVNGGITGNYLVATRYYDPSNTEWGVVTDFTTQPNPFKIVITSITATRVQGTFSGPIKKSEVGPSQLQITEGSFDLPIL